MADYQKAKW